MIWDVIKLIGHVLLMVFLTVWTVLFLALNDTANMFKFLSISAITMFFIWFTVSSVKDHIEQIIKDRGDNL